MAFTSVLQTPNARPGNIILAYVPHGAVVEASADLTAAAALSVTATARHEATTHLQGASTLAAGAALTARAMATLPGSGFFVGVAVRVVHPTADLVGDATFLPAAVVHAEARVSILGSSMVVAQGIPAQEGAADLHGLATCSVDSFKIAILRYLPPVFPVSVAVPQPYPRMTGQRPRTVDSKVVLPGPPPRTQIIGVRKPRT